MGLSDLGKKASERRVVMAREIARRWIEKHANNEYRLVIYHGAACNIRNLPGLLKSFRNGRIRIGGIEPDRDMGIEEGFDFVSVWSSNRSSMLRLKEWLENKGIETSGLW